MDTWSGTRHRDTLPLDAFIPAVLRRQFAQNPSLVLQPTTEHFHAALMLTDLSGFSSLAEDFSGRGPRGAEDLRDVLNFFCGNLVDLVEAHGGEVLKFAGDASLALWPIGDHQSSYAVRCAAQCALAAHHLFEQSGAPNGVRLRVRSGIGYGELWAANVGGVAGRWELLVSGDPLRQAADAVDSVGPGEIAVSSTTWNQLGSYARGTIERGQNIRLDAVDAPVPLVPSPVITLAPDAESLIRAYVPRFVQATLDARQSDWLGEFRRVTTLFIKLTGFGPDAHIALDQLQRAIVAVQTTVYRYGGSINQSVVDDKGTIMVCGWGLAQHAHGDDQVRAVRTALELRDALRQAGVTGSFGLTTGDVFAGLLGNSARCSYAMIGDAINVAARLMQAADGDIFCDLASFETARTRVAFETLPAIAVKGRERKVEVFRPVQLAAHRAAELIGRVPERRLLRERLDAFVTGRKGGVVLITGEPGIGKSRLVTETVERAITKGIRTMVAAGDAIERSAPYHVWHPLFDSLCGLDDPDNRADAERRLTEWLATEPRLLPFAPLLNPLLRCNFPETELSERVPPRGRALLVHELLIHLLRQTTGGRPTLLVLEDAHWLDSGSWALAEGIERELPEVLLLIAMRQAAEGDEPGELVRLNERERTLVIRLEELAPGEANALMCQRLQAREISQPVAQLIREKAEGHPFFIEELAHALRDRGLIQIEHGVCRFTAAAAAVEPIQLPNTVQVVISSRIDQLDVSQQLALKVASILGRAFDLAGLRAIYPVEVEPEQLKASLGALVERSLVQISPAGAEPSYLFTHAITQEVAYSLLPFALRRQLHAAAAAWFERRHRDDLSPFYPLLAHHWTGAEAAERAICYLDKAGEAALKRHANEEAVLFYRQAVELDDRFAPVLPADVPVVLGRHHTVSARDARRIRRERSLGDASTNLSRWKEGRRHFKNSLRVLGRPLPTSDRAFGLAIALEIGIQCVRRLGGRRFENPSPQAVDLMREAVCAYERIGSISYQNGRMIVAAYALVAALNLAERLGPTPELAVVCADVANVLGLIPLPRVARVYQRIAAETAARFNDTVIEARVRGRGAIYRLGIGDWNACQDLEEAMALFDRIGDSYLWEENAAIRARAAQLRGEFHLAARLGAEVRRRAAASGSLPHEIWGIVAENWAAAHLGHHQHVLDLAKTGLRLLSTTTTNDPLARLDFYGAIALAHLGRRELDLAHQAAEQILEVLAEAPRAAYFVVLGMSAAAETCLAVWEAEGDSRRTSEASAQAQDVCRRIERYARVSPPARARSLLWRGCAEWLQGRAEHAHARWRECLSESDRFALPYEAARAHYEIGRRLGRSDSARGVHLTQASNGFARLHAETDSRRVRAALQEG
jgi:class 3 adenylate cyclase/tetratricopeptide (TPR) repeat protein